MLSCGILLDNMKIAILSDLHLGYERFREDALSQASEALYAAAESADAILIAGDIFDYRHPKPEIMAEAISLFRPLLAKTFSARVSEFSGRGKAYTEIPIIAIPGTHERRTDGEIDPIDVLNLAGVLVNANQASVTIEKGEEKILVYGIGGTAEERFRETLSRLTPRPRTGVFSIFLFHQSVFEFLPFSKDFIKLEELPENFDLYVDGHIHSRIEAKCHGRDFLIPGSTVLTQLKEGEQEPKGFFIYDTLGRNYEFRRINSRKFSMVHIDVSGMTSSEASATIRREITKTAPREKGEKPVIRVVLEGRLKEGSKSIDLGISELVEENSSSAIIEVSKASMDSPVSKNAEDLRKGTLENLSIGDYGLSIFLEKLSKSGYNLDINPSELFMILSAEGPKDAIVKSVTERILSKGL